MRVFILLVILGFIAFSSAGVSDSRKAVNTCENEIDDGALDANGKDDLIAYRTIKKLTSGIESREPLIRTRRGFWSRVKKVHKKVKKAVHKVNAGARRLHKNVKGRYHKVLGKDGVKMVNKGLKAIVAAGAASVGGVGGSIVGGYVASKIK